MENTETPIITEEPTTVAETVTEETPKVNGEQPIVEEPTEEVTEKETSTTTTTTITEETAKPIEEQENVTDTNVTVPPPTCVSPGRANIPLKEVNETEKEEAVVHTNGNGTENTLSKKRELEDEQQDETPNGTDERVVDQTKKIKTTEVIDTPTIETNETEKNIIVNGNTAVEV